MHTTSDRHVHTHDIELVTVIGAVYAQSLSAHAFTLRDEPNIAVQKIVYLIRISARLQHYRSNRIYRGLGARVSCDMFSFVLVST